MKIQTAIIAITALAVLAPAANAQQVNMTFFITSVTMGKGGNLGGLAGADAYCQSLAQSVGAGGKTWHAYLSTQGPGAVNARDRIGKGPWQNAKGDVIATSVDDLHSDNPKWTKQTALNEKGEVINGFGDKPNRHDILTGSTADGRAFPADGPDRTCKNYTSTDGNVMFGHSDRSGPGPDAFYKSWNSSHPSRGCTEELFRPSGGDGLLYCFAVN